jgi:hypothetical protein
VRSFAPHFAKLKNATTAFFNRLLLVTNQGIDVRRACAASASATLIERLRTPAFFQLANLRLYQWAPTSGAQ